MTLRTCPSLAQVSLIAGLLLLGSGCTREAKFERHLKRADEFYANQQYDRAEIEYLNCLTLDPSKGQSIARLGLLYYDQGSVTRSIPYLKRARELIPDNLEIRAKIGALQLASGNKDGAKADALFIIQKDALSKDAPLLLADTAINPKEVAEVRQTLLALPEKASQGAPVLCALGVLELKEGRMDQGIALLQRAATADPRFDIPHVILGSIYQALNDPGKAEQEVQKASELAPINSNRRVLYAQLKLRQGDTATARKLLDEITAKNPSLIQPLMLLAEINASEKKMDEAGKSVAKVLARDPVNPDALLLRAKISQAQGNLDKAVVDLEKLISTFPMHGPGAVQLALVYVAKSELTKAVVVLKNTLATNPNFPEAALLLAELHVRQNDPGSAILLLTDLIRRFPKAPKPKVLLAEAYRAQGRLDEAVSTITQLANENPKDAQYPMLLGALCLQTKNTARAREAFEKAFASSNGNSRALQQLVNLDLAARKAPDALARVQKQIDSGRREPELYVMLGQIQFLLNDRVAAEASFRQAIAAKPEDRTPYFLLARLYVQNKETDKALDNLKVVVGKNPKDVGAWMLTGILLEDKKDWEGATTAYEKVLAVDPKFSPALNNLAYIFSERLNKPIEAQDLATKARDLQPHDPYAADTLGWILFRQGKYAWALSLIKESAEAMPSSAEVQYHLGMTHYMMGEETPARTAFDGALKLSDSFPGVEDCRKRIELLSIDPLRSTPETKAILEKHRSSEPFDPVVLARLAGIYTKTGDNDKATDLYQQILKGNPQNLSILRALARLSLATKDWNAAAGYAKTVRKTVSDDPEAGYILGVVALAGKDYKYAFSLLQEAQRKLPEDAQVAIDLGEAALSQGKLSEAKEAWNKALQLDPSSSKATATRQTLAFVEALQDKDSITRLAGDAGKRLDAETDNVPALMIRALAARNSGDRKTAKEVLEKALAKYPEFTPATRELALILAESPEEAQRAYELANKARETLTDDAELAKALGILSQQRGDYRRAIALLSEASKTLGDSSLFFNLGMAQMKQKPQIPEYKASLEKALALGLSGEPAVQAKAALAPQK